MTKGKRLASPGIERDVIACIMQDEAAYLSSDKLVVHDFDDPLNRALYIAIDHIYRKGGKPDPVTVTEILPPDQRTALDARGGWEYLGALGTLPINPKNVHMQVSKLQSFTLRRKMEEALMRGLDLIHETMDDQKLVDNVESELIEATANQGIKIELLGSGALEFAQERAETPAEVPGLKTGWTQLDKQIQGLQKGREYVIAARMKVGKALALDTPIPTRGGWVSMGDLKVGDEVFDEHGRTIKVIAVSEVWENRPCLEVVFKSGARIVADAEHEWKVRYDDNEEIRTTRELQAILSRHVHGTRPMIRTNAALDLPTASLPLSPYVLGAWLGDGTSLWAQITCVDDGILKEIELEGVPVRALKPLYRFALGDGSGGSRGKKLTQVAVDQIRTALREGIRNNVVAKMFSVTPGMVSMIRRGKAWTGNNPPSVQEQLRLLGVIGNKHIPAGYLRGSYDQRLALLQGLMDTDGYCDKRGTCEFTNTKLALVTGICELITSLGIKCAVHEGRATLKGRDCGPKWRVTFAPPQSVPVFRLERKRIRQCRVVAGNARSRWDAIVSVTVATSVPVRCIQVDSPSHLYLAGPRMTPTHNSIALLNVVKHVSVDQGVPTLLLSTEHPRATERSRLLARLSGVPEKRIGNGTFVLSENDADLVWEATKLAEDESKVPIYFGYLPHFSVPIIRKVVQKYTKLHGVGLVAFDYLKVSDVEEGIKEHQQLGNLAQGLKDMAGEFDVPILTAAQLGRNAAWQLKQGRGDVDVDDIADSDKIARYADVVMTMRKLTEKEESEHGGYTGKDSRVMSIKVSRNGGDYNQIMRLDGPTLTLTESGISLG